MLVKPPGLRILLRLTRSVATSTNWFSSPVVIQSKSRFQGHHRRLESPREVADLINAFASHHPHIIKKASHPHMYAWRAGTSAGSCDNGERSSGHVLLELLLKHNLNNVLVIVTRWYGGSKIGGSRFRRIAGVAAESLRLGGLISGEPK